MRTPATALLLAAVVLTACSAPQAAAPTARAKAPAPQPVEFRTASGITVTGRFYPAAAGPAPAVVLMHGGGGDMDEWTEPGIVAWLRRDAGAGAAAFPPLPAGLDVAVLIFDFHGSWLEAGRAAVEAARELPGVDPERIATIGSSAGADAAAAACRAAGCAGTLALSPMGSFDGVRFADTVAALSREGKIAWCLATTGDHGCPRAEGAGYREFVYPGFGHGAGMFADGGVPEAGGVMIDFLECALRRRC